MDVASAQTRSRLVWHGQRNLVATTGTGHEVRVDTTVDAAGQDSAAQPLETFLTGLGACTAMDVLAILEKMRFTVASFTLDLRAPRREEHPRVWTALEMEYAVESPDATAEGVRRAVTLSLTRYCSATAMVRSIVPVHARIVLNATELEPVELAAGA
jgi:putative redox protein